jgi:hypothetical protein
MKKGKDMDHRASECASAPIGHPSSPPLLRESLPTRPSVQREEHPAAHAERQDVSNLPQVQLSPQAAAVPEQR